MKQVLGKETREVAHRACVRMQHDATLLHAGHVLLHLARAYEMQREEILSSWATAWLHLARVYEMQQPQMSLIAYLNRYTSRVRNIKHTTYVRFDLETGMEP